MRLAAGASDAALAVAAVPPLAHAALRLATGMLCVRVCVHVPEAGMTDAMLWAWFHWPCQKAVGAQTELMAPCPADVSLHAVINQWCAAARQACKACSAAGVVKWKGGVATCVNAGVPCQDMQKLVACVHQCRAGTGLEASRVLEAQFVRCVCAVLLAFAADSMVAAEAVGTGAVVMD